MRSKLVAASLWIISVVVAFMIGWTSAVSSAPRMATERGQLSGSALYLLLLVALACAASYIFLQKARLSRR